MARIGIQTLEGDIYRITVKDESGSSTHEVTATQAELQQYGGGVSAERLLQASFEFLLERESKESILRSFKLPVIERYFPEYPTEIQKYLT